MFGATKIETVKIRKMWFKTTFYYNSDIEKIDYILSREWNMIYKYKTKCSCYIYKNVYYKQYKLTK